MYDETVMWLLYQELDRQLREATQRRLRHPVRIRSSADQGGVVAPGANEAERRGDIDD